MQAGTLSAALLNLLMLFWFRTSAHAHTGTAKSGAKASPNPAANGLALRPPMGWTSWTSAWDNPNQTYMTDTMNALLTMHNGVSLTSLGYRFVGLDDFWQACGTGVNQSFHDAAGKPLVNKTRFPDMSAMTEHAHRNNLTMGWYMNNCGCMETSQGWVGDANVEKHYKGDVEALASYRFDGAKFDGCGPFTDLDRWAALINVTGRPMQLENCHWGGDGPYITDDTTGDLWCPFNIYRSGADIAPGNWESFKTNLNSMVLWINKQTFSPAGPGNWPMSRPGCWAYPDSVQTGQYLRLEEDRSNFGAWCITSSPLILGMDVTDGKAVTRVWDILSNEEAISVNQAWAGHPGRLVKQSERVLTATFPRARPCTEAQGPNDFPFSDWVLGTPKANDGTRTIMSKSTGLCVDAWMKSPIVMEPCTGNASQSFVYDEATGTITAPLFPDNGGLLNGCLDISGKVGPGVQLTGCYSQPNDFFDFDSPAGVWSDRGLAEPFPKRCMRVENGTVVETQVFAKPLPNNGMAVFAFNAGRLHGEPASVSISLEDLLLHGRLHVRDVWNHQDLPDVTGTLDLGAIADHDSIFVVLTPA